MNTAARKNPHRHLKEVVFKNLGAHRSEVLLGPTAGRGRGSFGFWQQKRHCQHGPHNGRGGAQSAGRSHKHQRQRHRNVGVEPAFFLLNHNAACKF